MERSSTALIAYVPAPHRGYLELFRKYEGSTLFILGQDIINDFQPLVRHLPASDPEDVRTMVRALDIFSRVRKLTKDTLCEAKAFRNIVMPDEDVSRKVSQTYFAGKLISFENSWRLRWDWGETQKKCRPKVEGAITRSVLDRYLMRSAFKTAERSPDWWRQIGALLVKDKEVLIASFNQHVPCEQSAYLEGDPRSSFEQGQSIEVSAALHAEAGLVAEAARRGLSMEGCDLYVTTFPCPPCAYLCAHTGIKRLYYADGYSLIAGAETLHANGVEIVRVRM